jgi:type VI secretion system protein ImpA
MESDVSTANSSPEILPFPRLLTPIAGDKPAGTDLRTDGSPGSLYSKVRDARGKARALERRMQPGQEVKPEDVPDWRPVQGGAIQALIDKTKDLELTAYLIEALVRLHGFAGLRDGLRLARELVERFWDHLFPTPDEEGVLTRVAHLTGLNGEDAEGTLMDPISRVPITEATSVGRFSFLGYHEAMAVAKIADAKAKENRLKQGAPAPEVFQKAIAESSPKFYHALVADLTECLAQLAQYSAALDKRCGGSAPPTSAIKNALEDSLAIIKDVARDKLAAPPEAAKPQPGKPGGDGAPAVAAPGVISSREDAFRTLAEVATYFRRTDPQNLLSYALEQVVRWGRMPLPELLLELIPDEGPRKNLFKQVGIALTKPPDKKDTK